MKPTVKSIYELELHESITITFKSGACNMTGRLITRVENGWEYMNVDNKHVYFVPYGEKLKPKPPKQKEIPLTIDVRKDNFKAAIKKAVDQEPMYNNSVELNKFYDYWTEHNDSDKKMRFEKEKSWSTSRRLGRWFQNIKEREQNQVTTKSDVHKRLG